MSKENHKMDYKCIQFIRNPQKTDGFEHVALDYFDYIKIESKNSIEECVSTEQKIACEAYQTLSIFRDETEEWKRNPLLFKDVDECNENIPFLSILQITILEENYQHCESFNADSLKKCEEKLNKCISDIFGQLQADLEKSSDTNKPELKLKYNLYKSLNAMDFCIVLYTNMLELSLYLSNKISSVTVEDKPQYAVYTVVGIHRDFNRNLDIVIRDSVMVTRLRVKREFWIKIAKIAQDSQSFENTIKESNAHGLTGRYDYSVRIEGAPQIALILECLIGYKMSGKLTDKEELLTELESSNKLIFHLLKNQLVEYINERILTDVNNYIFDNDSYIPSNTIIAEVQKPKADVKEVNNKTADGNESGSRFVDGEKLIDKFVEVKQYIKEKLPIYPDIIKYLDKLNDIIYICNGLYSIYDTQISITMFREYVYSFLNLFELSCKAVEDEERDVKNWRDIITNLKEALNYLQQFIKIVTSINSSSFQAPKYDIVQNECSIAKFPIAYSQFLTEVCDAYYEHREKLGEEGKINDDEFSYFPHYKALMIPYMQKIESEFFMMVLFAQGISLDWKKEKEKWIKFNNKKNIVPIFVVCQSLEHYVDVASVIILSFHEIGHYNNSVTRKERNNIVLQICCHAIANKIVTAYCHTRDISLSAQYNLIMENAEIRKFANIISDILYNTVSKEKEVVDSEDAPNIIFLEKVVGTIFSIIKPEPPYYDEEMLYGNYAAYATDLIRYRYFSDFKGIDIENYSYEEHKDSLKKLYKKIYRNIQLLREDIETMAGEGEISVCRELLDNIEAYVRYAKEDIDRLLFQNESTDEIKQVYDNIYRLFGECKYSPRIKSKLRLCLHMVEYIVDSLNDLIAMISYSNDYELSTGISQVKEKNVMIKTIAERVNQEILCKNFKNSILEADLKNKLNISSVYTQKELEKNLFDACIKADISQDTIEGWLVCYSESLADAVMCINLDLTVLEYLIIISDIFMLNESIDYANIRRIILISDFIITKHNVPNTDPNVIYNEIIDMVRTNKYTKVLVNGNSLIEPKENAFLEKLYNVLSVFRQHIQIVYSPIYKLILKNLLENKEYFKFVEGDLKEDIAFVKDYLDAKVSNDPFKDQLDKKQIEFILKKYYENRNKYKKPIEKGRDING